MATALALTIAAIASCAAQDVAAVLPAAPVGVALALPYRVVVARHLYDTYRQRIYQGRLPPLLYAIAITETEIDEHGRVVAAVVIREPAAAKEVGSWVLELIRAANPYPPPVAPGYARVLETWLVHRNGTFQLDTLTEGQD